MILPAEPGEPDWTKYDHNNGRVTTPPPRLKRAVDERMVAEVRLGRVGPVVARDVSRFARNSRKRQQLVEICRIVDTVLIDQETVYAARP